MTGSWAMIRRRFYKVSESRVGRMRDVSFLSAWFVSTKASSRTSACF